MSFVKHKNIINLFIVGNTWRSLIHLCCAHAPEHSTRLTLITSVEYVFFASFFCSTSWIRCWLIEWVVVTSIECNFNHAVVIYRRNRLKITTTPRKIELLWAINGFVLFFRLSLVFCGDFFSVNDAKWLPFQASQISFHFVFTSTSWWCFQNLHIQKRRRSEERQTHSHCVQCLKKNVLRINIFYWSFAKNSIDGRLTKQPFQSEINRVATSDTEQTHRSKGTCPMTSNSTLSIQNALPPLSKFRMQIFYKIDIFDLNMLIDKYIILFSQLVWRNNTKLNRRKKIFEWRQFIHSASKTHGRCTRTQRARA